MNKTVTINLSGIVFHIDENAYELLKKYLEKLKAHFSTTQGKEEIIADIESRLAEMFTERNADASKVIMATDVEQVILAMGKPEELSGNEEEEQNQKSAPQPDQTIYYENGRKRFFRNPDDKVLGGVCSGISAYFDIDPIYLRLVFGLSVIFAGTGILLYIILWFIIPEAKTTSDKLLMRGERVNIATIEKNVREEMESLKKRGEVLAGELSSDEMKHRVRSSSQKVGDFIGDVLRAFGKFIAGVFGLVITIFSIAVLVGLTIAIFSGIGVFSFAVPHEITNMVLTNSQLWWLVIGGILAIGIPFTLLLLNGLKILFKVKLNLRMIGAVMAGLWLVGIAICILTGIRIASEYQRSATIKQSIKISSVATGPLVLRSNTGQWDDAFRQDEAIQFGDLFILDASADSVMNRMVHLDIEQSENDSVYLVSTLYSRGKTYDEAKQLADDIHYNYRVNDSVILFPKYFNLSIASKFRGQHVKMVLKLPVGKSVVLDKSLEGMLDDVSNVTDTWDWDMLGHEWKMTKDGLECNQCPGISDKDGETHTEQKIKIDSGGIEIKTL
ncbi:MAG: PspC domain-containing protein [Chitinophagales bacterium]|nr:PspC domain-containing protein [Chitinophagales bacterium]